MKITDTLLQLQVRFGQRDSLKLSLTNETRRGALSIEYFQAREAKGMIAEAARMKKDAERMHPGVVASNTTTVTGEAPVVKKRTRGPNKPKTVVADAAQ